MYTTNHPLLLHIGTRCVFLQISDRTATLQFCSVPWLALLFRSSLFSSDLQGFTWCSSLCCTNLYSSLVMHAVEGFVFLPSCLYCVQCLQLYFSAIFDFVLQEGKINNLNNLQPAKCLWSKFGCRILQLLSTQYWWRHKQKLCRPNALV